jgi:prepilin-type N-terminal cleavage/methylation domain-containing protein
MKIRARHFHPMQSGFTMVEIAISLAIIGIALVAIIGVLPIGMNVQRDNREQTVINQDATIFMEAIRNGERGLDDLTNYVYLITNTVTEYNNLGQPINTPSQYGYTYVGSTLNGSPTTPQIPINDGTNIIGLLSTPKYQNAAGFPLPNLINGGFSNHVVAYVRSMSGPAVEKPPQDNQIIQQDSFGYRILCDNVPVQTAEPTNSYFSNLAFNLHELRLTFLWPQQPNGKVGAGRWTYRALVAGQLTPDVAANSLYFFHSQSFTNSP